MSSSEPMDISGVVAFDRAMPEIFALRPDADRIRAGSPDQTVWNFFTDTTGQFSAGIWEGQPGCWAVTFTENEFCHLLSGKVVVRDEAGNAATFRAGDSFVMPAGFTGTWEVIETARKLYATFEPKAVSETKDYDR
jgi:uncharacterized protein